jgi:hypothetical protein
MAVINYKEGDDPTKKNQFGVVSGVNLVSPVILNKNPLDIESVNRKNPEQVTSKWNTFHQFLSDKNITIDINSLQGKETISEPLINEFNNNKKTSIWASKGNSQNNPLTRDDIFAIQRFTSKTDPNVQIDGWVGTQTIQMLYPRIEFLLAIFTVNNKEYGPNQYPESPETLIPIIWGDKRFVIPLGAFRKANETKTSSWESWRLYNPVTDKENLPWNNVSRVYRVSISNQFKQWDQFDNTINIENTLSINENTLKEQRQKLQFQNQTNLTNLITR